MKLLTNKYFYTISIFLILGACNKQLNQQPYQQIQQSQAIQTAADVQITLVGAYNRAGLSDVYGGGAYLYPDLMATQTVINWQGTYQGLTQLVGQTIPNDNGFINGLWAGAYQVINQANNVLANIKKVAPADSSRTAGEARFLRGMVYFDLVRLFGRSWNDGDPTKNLGVPIVLTPTVNINSGSYVVRATVAQGYQQSITDLTIAENELPLKNNFYASSYAASALLARLYLQKGDFANAASEATKVISSGIYSLNANYTDEFPYPGGIAVHVDNTPEDIFAFQVTNQLGNNYLHTFYGSADFAGRGDIVVQDTFAHEFETGDTRLNIYIHDSGNILRCDKFDNNYGNVHIVRLAELYLIRAESNLQLSAGSAIGDLPLNDINIIRKRAGISPLLVATVANVLTERRHELTFEGGLFFHDAKRLGQNITPLSYSSPKLVFPIPLQDINANPKLIQNPGY